MVRTSPESRRRANSRFCRDVNETLAMVLDVSGDALHRPDIQRAVKRARNAMTQGNQLEVTRILNEISAEAVQGHALIDWIKHKMTQLEKEYCDDWRERRGSRSMSAGRTRSFSMSPSPIRRLFQRSPVRPTLVPRPPSADLPRERFSRDPRVRSALRRTRTNEKTSVRRERALRENIFRSRSPSRVEKKRL